MKLLIVLMTTCLIQVSAAGFAQKVTYAKKGATLEQIFGEIRKQTGYFVVYAEGKVNKQAKLDVNFRNTDLTDVLDVISKSQDLSYSINEKNIGLKPKESSFLDDVIARFQAVDIRGRVADSLGNGLAGATITVKNGKGGTTANNNGDFVLKNAEEGSTLMIAYLGYVTKEVVADKEFTYVELVQSSSKLDEVQIQAYGKTSRRLATGNIVTIKADEIAKQPINNPLLALQAKVPNLVISPNSGLPGAGINLQLRGQNSLSGASLRSEPLIVIDGVPQQNNLKPGFGTFGLNNGQISSLSLLNPKDIEQIDVLSDADATSIYGSRGGSGVVLITTKRGKAGQTSVDASVYTGYSAVSNKLTLLKTEQYLQMRKEAYAQDGLIAPTKTTADKNSTNFDLTLWDQNQYTDWQQEFLGRNAPNTTANVSVSGGTTTFQYLMGANFVQQKYVYPGEAKNSSGGVNFGFNANSPNQKFKSAINGSFNYNSAFTPLSDFTRQAVTLAPNAPSIYIGGNELNWAPNSNDASGRGSWKNPYAQLLNTTNAQMTALRTSTDISYTFTGDLVMKLTAGISRITNRTVNMNPIAAQDPALTNTGSSGRVNLWSNSLTMDPQVIYNKTLFGGQISSVFGLSYQYQNQLTENISGRGYTSDALMTSLGNAPQLDASNTSSQYKYFGIFGRINYNNNNKYILNLSARRDGSSRFGPGNQYGNFWSVGGAWIFSEESLIKDNINWLGFAKIRGSYGSSGNDGIGDYQFIELYEGMPRDEYQGIKGVKSNGAIDPNYHWEDLRKLEVAVDLGFIKDRLLLSAAYWRTRGFDQLGKFPLPLTAGVNGGAITINRDIGIQNMGWDFTVTSKNIVHDKFTWTSSAIFGIQSNRLLSDPVVAGVGEYNRFIKVGQPFFGFSQAYEFRGVNPVTGNYQFTDRAGNISTDPNNSFEDAKKIDTRPLTVGISHSFLYGNFNLSFFLELTRRLQRNPILDFAFIGNLPGSFVSGDPIRDDSGNLPAVYLQHWTSSGSESSIGRLTSYTAYEPMTGLSNKVYASDYGWVDASYMRLRNLSLSYNFNHKLSKRLGLQDLAVSLQAQNLLTLTNYEGLDPEIGNQSVLPLLRTIVAGVQLKF